MNIKHLVIIFVSLIWTKGISQKKNRDITNTPISIFIEAEKQFTGGKINDPSVDSPSENLEIISFIRKDNSVPNLDLIVRYIFSKSDSLVKEIRFELDIANFDKKIDNKQDKEFRKALAKHYLILEGNLVSELGEGTVTGKLTDKTLIDTKIDYFKNNCWTVGQTKIDLLIEMSNSYNPKKPFKKPIHKIINKYSTITSEKLKTEYNSKKTNGNKA